MHTVLAYDVSSDKRRRRLFRKLHRFLLPVQESVFEGPLDRRLLAKLEALLHRTIDMEEDSVRIYRLCDSCRAATTSWGACPDLTDPAAMIVIGP